MFCHLEKEREGDVGEERGGLQTRAVIQLLMKLRLRHPLKISLLNLKYMSGLKENSSPQEGHGCFW